MKAEVKHLVCESASYFGQFLSGSASVAAGLILGEAVKALPIPNRVKYPLSIAVMSGVGLAVGKVANAGANEIDKRLEEIDCGC